MVVREICDGCWKSVPIGELSRIWCLSGEYCHDCTMERLKVIGEQSASERVFVSDRALEEKESQTETLQNIPQRSAPSCPLLPAVCLTTVLPNGKGEPDWDGLKQLPVHLWEHALQETFGGWKDPEYRINKSGKRTGPYLYWRWREGKKQRSKYLGVMR